MDFDLTPEQQQLADTVHRWAEKDYGFDARKKMIHAGSGSAEASWQALAELGVLALPVPEAQGGFDGSALDMMVVMQELGRALVVEPVFATALGVEFLKLSGQHPTLLEQVAAGELKLACALGEQQSRYDLFDIATTAVVSGDGFVIDGTKSVVLHGEQAGCLIVSARTPTESLCEIMELPRTGEHAHPWYMGVQYHPEFKSTPRDGHPLFISFIKAALAHKHAAAQRKAA